MDFFEQYNCDLSPDSIRLFATPTPTAKSTFLYVQEVGYFKTQPNYYTERSNLNSYLIVFTLSGKGHLTYRGKDYSVLPNQAFFINCMEHHYYRTDEKDLWELLWVHFNGSPSQGYFNLFMKNSTPVVSLGEGTAVPELIRKILREQQNWDVRTEIAIAGLIAELLTEILLSGCRTSPGNACMPDYVQSAVKLLDTRFTGKITLDGMSEQYNVSKFHFLKEFKKFIGLTPNEYLIRARINYAKELLKYSGRSVADIAESAGINNASHFINLFKARTGVSPLAYRNKWKNPFKGQRSP
jgi:AraC-like DNA-binding protein